MVASRSRWLVGSSSSRRSGLANKAVARATRMRQPPEKESKPGGPGLFVIKAEAGEDDGGAGGGGVGADGAQAFVHFGEAVRGRPRLSANCRVRRGGRGVRGHPGEDGFEQGLRHRRGLPVLTWAMVRAGGEANFAAVERWSRRRWQFAAGWTCRRRCGRRGRCAGLGRSCRSASSSRVRPAEADA